MPAAFARASVNVVVYRGLDAAAPLTALAASGTAGTTTHTTPGVAAASGEGASVVPLVHAHLAP